MPRKHNNNIYEHDKRITYLHGHNKTNIDVLRKT